MSVKYSAVPTSDSHTVDFSSPFNYKSETDFTGYYTFRPANGNRSQNLYRSAFEYSGQTHDHNGILIRSKTSFCNRCCSSFIIVLCHLLVFLTFPISAWFCFKIIQQYEEIVIFRLGKQQPPKGTGYVFVMPCVDKYVRVDMRTRAFNVPPQRIFTYDNAIVEIGADVYFRICDAVKSVMDLQDLNHAIRVLTQTTMVKILARDESSDIDKNKNRSCEDILTTVNATTRLWGVELSKIELSQVKVLVVAPPKNPLGQLQGLFPFLGSSTSTTPGTAPPSYEHIATQQFPPPLQPGLNSQPTNDSSPQKKGIANQLLQLVNPLLSKALVEQYNAIYQFEVQGENSGVYYMDLKTGRGSVGEGPSPLLPADVTLSMTEQDLVRMFTGDLKAMQAYMSGQLQVSGDLNAAMQLEDLISKVKQSCNVFV